MYQKNDSSNRNCYFLETAIYTFFSLHKQITYKCNIITFSDFFSFTIEYAFVAFHSKSICSAPLVNINHPAVNLRYA